MNNGLLKARYTQQHKLKLIMDGNWTNKKDTVKKFITFAPDYSSVTASYNAHTDTTEVTLSWSTIDECPEYMLQP